MGLQFLSSDVFVQLWYQDYACLKNDLKNDLSFLFSEKICGKVLTLFLLEIFCRIHNEALNADSFLCGTVFEQEINF